ncbi:MAG: S8 family serine peptidase, partial [Bacteroidetes bacterium]|nr:S8 family serine peptidase [Bacteroidota bacterium]
MKHLFTFFMLFSQVALAQDFNRYMVFFTDKAASPYSIDSPEEFLTARAIERRVKFQIPITEQDLPVNEQYVQQIREQGVPVFYRSRWLNAVMVQETEEKVSALSDLAFVQDIIYVAPGAKLNARQASIKQNFQEEVPQDQHELLGIPLMQELGYTGQGKLIAVFDDGFRGVDSGDKFDHLYRNNQLLHTWDFVANATGVYQYDDHGTRSLATIAVIDSGTFIGTAPDAQFLLAVTEDYYTEYVVEEYNWLIASEWADSLGADIITSSLGYTTYDDPAMDYSQSDMDGKTTVAARAANWATDRGMLIVSSAGNSRSTSWGTISTPAD